MAVSCAEMQEIEGAAFARGVSAGDLMERAGMGIAAVIRELFPRPGLAVLYLGKGNNGGDALVAGRELKKLGWRLAARLGCEPDELKPLPSQHWNELQPERWGDGEGVFAFQGPVLLLDGLLGIGSSGALRGTMRELAAEMNRLRVTRHASTVAMDLPSGLDGDSGEPGEDAVVADVTVTVARVKTGLLADAATAYVGRLALVPLVELGKPDAELITAAQVRAWLPRRNFAMHKGQAGRVTLIAGSRGYLGAAVLASMGALRGGAGLITLLALERDYELLAMKVPPEVMVKPVRRYADGVEGADVIAVGPGLGGARDAEILALIKDVTAPMVVDADGLNALARKGLPKAFAGPRLLTPHPGEMARLLAKSYPEWEILPRREQAESFANEYGVTLLLKGARTVVAASGRPTQFNSTGTPGMACGGMGDVLTGLSAALIAQGMSLHQAGCAGSWLLGRAAEMAVATGVCSEESLAAEDVAEHLGYAFDEARGH